MDILFLIGGLLLILLGANGLTDGASAVAKRFHIPNIVMKGSADIAVGNVVGSNIFNALMIVGCTAMFAPIVVQRNTLLKEIPLCILASLALLVMGNDMLLDHAAENVVSITDGLILLCFMAIFLSYTFAIAKTNQALAPSPTSEVENGSPTVTAEDGTEIKDMPLWRSTLYIIGGLAGLIWGGQLFVDGASGIARSLGVSESVIGLTLVAGGTSLPELATSIVAALKKNPEIAIGNVVGSNLFNIFFVLGCSASITPLHLTGINNLDLLVLVASSILLWIFGVFFGKRTITRIEGSLLIACYVGYTAWLICHAS